MRPALRFCSTPGCRALVERGACPDCARKRDHLRGSAHARGYDDTWARYSRRWLQAHRLCGERADGSLHGEHSECVRQGLRTHATVTDHITPLRAGGAKYDPANHQSLCRVCHAIKTVTHDGGLAVVR